MHTLRMQHYLYIHFAGRVPVVASHGAQRVKLIKKYNARAAGACALEHLPDSTLTFPHKFVEQLRSLHGNEVSSTTVCKRLCEQGLAATRRAVQQNTFVC